MKCISVAVSDMVNMHDLMHVYMTENGGDPFVLMCCIVNVVERVSVYRDTLKHD